MKKIYKLFAVAALAVTFTLTSCIEETVSTSTFTEENVNSSSKATEGLLWGMSSFLNYVGVYSDDRHYDWGYGSLMHVRDVLTGDLAVVSSGYNWYSNWASNQYQGRMYVYSAFPWYYYTRAIKSANNAIASLKKNTSKESDGQLGVAYAYRSLFYLDAARMYEFLPNDIYGLDYRTENADEGGDDETYGKCINYLTIPIVTEETPEDSVWNNPRVSHEAMYTFIHADLDSAEHKIINYNRSSKVLPNLACVYGLKARLYMWNAGYLEEIGADSVNAEYAKAEAAAQAAINEGGNTPLTKSEWLDTQKGFNDMSMSSWMWAANAMSDDDVVGSGILNWTSWMSPEATFGYAAAGPMSMIASNLYDRIHDEDFRKLSFIAPEDGELAGQEPLLVTDPNNEDDYMRDYMPDYTGIKFRPGKGNPSDYKEAAACDYPLMRVEEMYLIQAEAAAHQDGGRGRTLINDFMKAYRNPVYNFNGSSKQAVIDECFLQKRIELWGEGQIFFDYKRLNKSVDRSTSSNWDAQERFKTNGRPAWMNLTIIISEENNNKGIKGYNNPDPSGKYTPVR